MMFNKLTKAFIAAPSTVSMVFATLFTSGIVASSARADDYWGCRSGYVLQVREGAARCYKAAENEYAAPLPCPRINTPFGPLGASLRMDANGNNDVCATMAANVQFTGEVVCGFGYTMERREGADRCFKRIASDFHQPDRRVSR